MKKVVYEIHDFPELLSLRGHRVTFVDFPEGEPDKGGLRRLVDLSTTTRRGQTRAHAGSSVDVITPGRVLPPPLDRPAASLSQWPVIHREITQGNYDAVILYGVPTNGWQTIFSARRAGVPVLFRAIDISHQLRKTRLGPLIKIAEDFIYRNATAISCHNEPLRQYCISRGARPERVSVEYPGLDLEKFAPAPRNPELAASLGIQSSHKVAMFMGTLYRFAGLDWFLQQFAPVLLANDEFRVLLLGGGEDEQKLRDLARSLGIADRVIFTGFINYDQLPDYLRLADVAFNSFRPTPVTECALPGKILQYLGCGLPSVCTPLAGLRSMLGENQGIVFCELAPPFVDEVTRLLQDNAVRAELARQGRAAMEELCSWDHSIFRFEEAIRRTIQFHINDTERG